ncbi:type II secretion system F family protein [Aliidiomarina celeris]|uniref:type II secretion system F family protein n=1 Tax=Aliidiomarina celeris TaxID=2249428 RepID=UPI000DE9E9F4|nr:type II secretion system F family protein [Aliidiomarina celeris]
MLGSVLSPSPKISWYRWHGYQGEQHQHALSGVERAANVSLLALTLAQRNVTLTRFTTLPQHTAPTDVFWQSWCERLHSLTATGFDLAAALQALSSQCQSAHEAEVCASCLQALERGQSMVDAIRTARPALAPALLQQLKFGEQAGFLPETLAAVASQLKKRNQSRARTRKALLYPISVLVMATLLFVGLKLFILPKFAQLYEQSGASLPWITQLVLTPSEVLPLSKLLTASTVLVFTVALLLIWRRTFLHSMVIQHALFQRKLWREYIARPALIRELDTMANGLSRGMTLHQSLQNIALYSPHRYHRYLWLQCIHLLEQGHTIERIFAPLHLLPMELMRLSLGERSGQLEQQLAIIVSLAEQTIEQRMALYVALLPQLVLVGVSVLTGLIMIALYLPLFQLGLAVG